MAPGRVLYIHDLAVRYGPVTAVRDATLYVDPGEFVAVVGPNGAGKTSLLHAAAGLVSPAAGSVSIGGVPLLSLKRCDVVRHGVALAPEGREIFASLTVLENLKLGATIRRDAKVRADIAEVLKAFPILGERRHQPAGLLSGGEQQQLAIARAMLSKPKLLMLDEPSLGLAPAIIAQVYQVLKTIHAQGVAILLVEQNASRAFALANRAYVMSHGAFTLTGTPAALAKNRNFDAAYFGMAAAVPAFLP